MAITKTIWLIGFSGSGKSTIGPLLAKRLKVDSIDTDRLIEKQQGLSIKQIFEQHGERYFRAAEKAAIEKLTSASRRGRVIALGGGAFENQRLRRSIQETGLVVYLSCARLELYRRLKRCEDRPLINVAKEPGLSLRQSRLERLGQLMDKRLKNYQLAEMTIATTNKTPRQVAAELAQRIKAVS